MQRVITMVALATLAIGCSDSDTNTTEQASTPTPPTAQPVVPESLPDTTREELAAIKAAKTELAEFECDDGLKFEVEFVDQGLLTAINDMPLDLRQQPSGSGSLYADDTWSLHIKGQEAVLSSGDVSRECQTRSALAEAGERDPQSELTEAALNTDGLNDD